VTTTLRQLLFAPDQWKKHEEEGTLLEYLRDLAMQRAGLNGTLDPIIQMATNLRYNADITSLMLAGEAPAASMHRCRLPRDPKCLSSRTRWPPLQRQRRQTDS
jgi:hypothetical protein